MRLILVAGTTATAAIDGISAAGANPRLMAHTPSADAEIVEYGRPVRAPVVPVSPTGCPTPAAITRAARTLVGFETLVVDGGLAEPTGAATVSVGARPGRDVREADPVPTAPGAFEAARRFGERLPDAEIVVGETIPGGTTTALGILRALGEEWSVSSSLPENPGSLKAGVVADGLAASGMSPGDAAGDPARALRRMGDPVLAVVAGLSVGALDAGIRVTLGGGTQLLAAAALVRHAGVEAPLSLATTSFVADDVPDLPLAAGALDLGLTVTDPGFDGRDEPALASYVAGEAKEGAGMGGALALADRAGALPEVAGETLDTVATLEADDGS
ncbi:nicotinate-nucleotide--dimethylbenzimidazole phosphoribosyltransferase [Halegenticoccus tardaugens]|uniref:nicotinate-nucleotide--dimethylbenzimidazole phosphoribosyltransferase n=1 Tax=Halegenticoccus tardaugens TaxID=2071624 RepID=UPI00100B383B|nr:nicotinate-nucleotide--dimethylbenzimidazole phosphoribosyltransferase [Halegenticoccus tardaugens]